MSHEHHNLKNNLKNSEEDPLSDFLENYEKERVVPPPPSRQKSRYFLIGALILALGFYFSKSINNTSLFSFPNFSSVVNIGQPSEDLLNRMNARMVEMGYTGLSHDDLRELRSQGVTATYVSNVRALGFNDLTLEEAVRLSQANASSTFIAMMIELGYELDVEDFVRLRRAGVTAHYTSNVHDFGYRDVTIDQLIRLQRIGVTPSLIERLQQEQGEDIPLEEIIRYRISNQ